MGTLASAKSVQKKMLERISTNANPITENTNAYDSSDQDAGLIVMPPPKNTAFDTQIDTVPDTLPVMLFAMAGCCNNRVVSVEPLRIFICTMRIIQNH